MFRQHLHLYTRKFKCRYHQPCLSLPHLQLAVCVSGPERRNSPDMLSFSGSSQTEHTNTLLLYHEIKDRLRMEADFLQIAIDSYRNREEGAEW
jgi:hypothetical protein